MMGYPSNQDTLTGPKVVGIRGSSLLYKLISVPAFVDFTLLTRTIVLSPNASQACVSILIQDDIIAEFTEFFQLNLSSDDIVVEFTVASIEISIEDNDGGNELQ